MSNNRGAEQLSSSTLIRGGFVGVAIAALFLIISGIVFWIASRLGLERNLAILLGVVSGPLIGGVIVVVMLINGWLVRLLGLQPADRDSDLES